MNVFAPLLVLPAAVLSLTLHEFAHAWMIARCGDDGVRGRGRYSLDPAAHLDGWGLGMVFVSALFGAPLVGWGRPVAFDEEKLRDKQRDPIWIALAGPLCNLALAAVWMLALWAAAAAWRAQGAQMDQGVTEAIATLRPELGSPWQVLCAMLAAGVLFNVQTAAFNLLPLPPLDGFFVLRRLAPARWSREIAKLGVASCLLLFATLPALHIVLKPFVTLADIAVRLALGGSV